MTMFVLTRLRNHKHKRPALILANVIEGFWSRYCFTDNIPAAKQGSLNAALDYRQGNTGYPLCVTCLRPVASPTDSTHADCRAMHKPQPQQADQ